MWERLTLNMRAYILYYIILYIQYGFYLVSIGYQYAARSCWTGCGARRWARFRVLESAFQGDSSLRDKHFFEYISEAVYLYYILDVHIIL